MSETPLGGEKYIQRPPDSAYLMGINNRNTRLQSEVRQKTEALLDAQTAYKKMIELLEVSTVLQNEQIELTKLQRPRGKVADMSLVLQSGASARLAHIDFIAGNMNSASILPANVNLDFPFAKLYSLQITNDGPATIYYSTNEAKGSGKASARLLANETDDLGRYPFPSFETLNVTLEAGSATSATIRIRGLT